MCSGGVPGAHGGGRSGAVAICSAAVPGAMKEADLAQQACLHMVRWARHLEQLVQQGCVVLAPVRLWHQVRQA
ncbi:hypothetical protein RIF29_30134 [Crotalaria pallida]|uniref:Uncharacterized protein n=1 Tax=Crotalaria pallida TaxID=3830 RepID=A0AAN9EG99_CROPI